jgi:hypothetical protein
MAQRNGRGGGDARDSRQRYEKIDNVGTMIGS